LYIFIYIYAWSFHPGSKNLISEICNKDIKPVYS
jgi:hypothetical protein